MKINKKYNRKNLTIFAIIAVVLLTVFTYIVIFNGSIFGWQLHSTQRNTNDSTGYTTPSDAQIKNGQQIKQKTTGDKNATSGSDHPQAPVTQANGKNRIQLDITSITKAGSTLLKVSTLISFLDQTGSCNLSMQDSDANLVYKASVGVQPMSNSSTCKGFEIPVGNLTPGIYKFYLTYSSADSKTYGSTEKSYVFQFSDFICYYSVCQSNLCYNCNRF